MYKDYDKLYKHADHSRVYGYDYEARSLKAIFREVKDIDANGITSERKFRYEFDNQFTWIPKSR